MKDHPNTIAGILTGIAAATFLVLASQAAWAEGDPTKGEKVYKKCKTCHSLEAGKNKVGPHLNGVIGREAGTVEGFKYSSAQDQDGLPRSQEGNRPSGRHRLHEGGRAVGG
jgi:cytochrome c